MENNNYHTYMVQRNKYTINKNGETVQVGGDWYSVYTSKGTVRIPEDVIRSLVSKGCSAREIERAGKKINDSFKLSGSIILVRGTPFGNTTIYREDNGIEESVNEVDEETKKELNSLIELSETQSMELQYTQQKIRALSKKILDGKTEDNKKK